MRIATWNLERCPPGASARVSTLAAMMAEVNADVWVLTETYQAFSPGPEYRLAAHSADAPDRDASRGECWVAIWSRLAAELVSLTEDLERVAAAKIGRDVVVVGTVLPWRADNRDPVLRGAAAFLARLAEQSADWQRLRSTLKGGLCVIGDFNEHLRSSGDFKVGSTDGRRALQGALNKCDLDCLTSGEDDPLLELPGRACIDQICVAGMRALARPRSSAWPPPGTLSQHLTDHYCSYADVELSG